MNLDVLGYCGSAQERWLGWLQEIVDIDSGSLYQPGLEAMVGWMQSRWEALGFETAVRTTETGPHLIASHRSLRKDAARILLLGHVDTVYSEGTAMERPFTIKGDRAFGPGVADMKGGLVTLLGAVEALKESEALDGLDIVAFHNSDEEIGSRGSHQIIEELVAGCDAVFVYEPGRPSGAIVTQRKGLKRYLFDVRGRAAHTGVDPQSGASAVEELSRKVLALHGLTDYDRGVTVNVGVIRGGDRPNVVADWATAQVDVRLPDKESFAATSQAIEEIISRCGVEGTQATFEVTAQRPPFVKAAGTGYLLELIDDAADRLGISVPSVATGGGSDGNFTAALGIPTVDALGAIGGRYHSDGEYLVTDSLAARAALSALVLSRIEKSQFGGKMDE